jgi:hypothetical protein
MMGTAKRYQLSVELSDDATQSTVLELTSDHPFPSIQRGDFLQLDNLPNSGRVIQVENVAHYIQRVTPPPDAEYLFTTAVFGTIFRPSKPEEGK